MSRVAGRPSASAPTDGSRTITLRDSQPNEDDGLPSGSGEEGNVGSLRLRGAPRTRRRPRVVWREDVVDNEHLGKKSSKICCIYHRPKRFDESSSEESSDSDEGSDSSCGHNHSHAHRHDESNRSSGPSSSGQGSSTAPRQSGTTTHTLFDGDAGPNSYERAPGRKSDKGKAPAPKQA